jgi:hypothetical protein
VPTWRRLEGATVYIAMTVPATSRWVLGGDFGPEMQGALVLSLSAPKA